MAIDCIIYWGRWIHWLSTVPWQVKLSWSSSPLLPSSFMLLSTGRHSARLFPFSHPSHFYPSASGNLNRALGNQRISSHRPPTQLEQRLRASSPTTGKGHWRSGAWVPDTLFFRVRKIVHRAYGPAPPPFMLCQANCLWFIFFF